METIYEEYKLKWGSIPFKDKKILYVTYVYFIFSPPAILYTARAEGKNFCDVFVDVMKTENESANSNSFSGYIKSLNEYGFTKSETRYPENPKEKPGYENKLILTNKGVEFFFLMNSRILEFGRKEGLYRYLPEVLKKQIPEKYLTE